jgi:hypothetical protein
MPLSEAQILALHESEWRVQSAECMRWRRLRGVGRYVTTGLVMLGGTGVGLPHEAFPNLKSNGPASS